MSQEGEIAPPGGVLAGAAVFMALAGGLVLLAISFLTVVSGGLRWLTSQPIRGDFELISIGSGLGVRNPHNLSIILELVKARHPDIPVIVDAGVGVPSDAAFVMEMGADGVLMNTAIALAKHPAMMAEAMRDGVRAGRMAHLAGRMPMKRYASASSPLEGLFTTR